MLHFKENVIKLWRRKKMKIETYPGWDKSNLLYDLINGPLNSNLSWKYPVYIKKKVTIHMPKK
jgi:hypothetical protein